MIAVTCRNREHFSLDPDSIERVEDRADVSVFLGDGTHYVIGESFEELIRKVRDHRAARVSARRLITGPGSTPPGYVPGRPPRRRTVPLVTAVPGPAED